MKHQPVESSSIKSVGYDEDKQELHVRFKTGKTYAYAGVTPRQHQALLNAPSVGGHFSAHIRNAFSAKPV